MKCNNIIDSDNLPEWAQFQASLTDHPIVLDERGRLRYQMDPLMRWLADAVDLNYMWLAYGAGEFSRAKFMGFYRDIGYSLDGFEEIWGDELDGMEGWSPQLEEG